MGDGNRVPGSARDSRRGDRLSAALRANLKRRKEQARGQSGAAAVADGHKTTKNRPKTGENKP